MFIGESVRSLDLARKYQNKLILNATDAEKEMMLILDSIGLKYRFQEIFRKKGTFKIVDFFLPGHETIIEIDGGHHFTRKGRKYDKQRTKFLLRKCKLNDVIRFTNSFVLKNQEMIGRILSRRFFPGFKKMEIEDKNIDDQFKRTIGVI